MKNFPIFAPTLLLAAACQTAPSVPPVTPSAEIVDITSDTEKDVHSCGEYHRPITGKLKDKEITACLRNEVSSIANLEKGCERLSEWSQTPFELDAVKHTTPIRFGSPTQRVWTCRQIITSNDKISAATFCPGVWSGNALYFGSHEMPQGFIALYHECILDPYGSEMHYILANCPKLAQNINIPLGTFDTSLKPKTDGGGISGLKSADYDPSRTVLYKKCE